MEKTSVVSDVLAPLTEETRRAIAAGGVVRTFPKGSILINEGDTGDSLYIVLSGRVKVFASNAAGREIVLSFFGLSLRSFHFATKIGTCQHLSF